MRPPRAVLHFTKEVKIDEGWLREYEYRGEKFTVEVRETVDELEQCYVIRYKGLTHVTSLSSSTSAIKMGCDHLLSHYKFLKDLPVLKEAPDRFEYIHISLDKPRPMVPFCGAFMEAGVSVARLKEFKDNRSGHVLYSRPVCASCFHTATVDED